MPSANDDLHSAPDSASPGAARQPLRLSYPTPSASKEWTTSQWIVAALAIAIPMGTLALFIRWIYVAIVTRSPS